MVNGNRDSLAFDGMADAEVERRMKVCFLTSNPPGPQNRLLQLP